MIRFLAALYVICILIAGLGESMFFPDYMKIVSAGAIGMALLVLFLMGDFYKLDKIAGFFGVYCLLLLGILLWSAGIWLFKFQPGDSISRGVSKLIYQLINILVVASAVYLFRERAIHYTFYGIALCNFAILLLNLRHFGISNAIETFRTFVLTMGEASGFMKQMEIHDMTFTYGFFILYFSCFDRGKKLPRAVNITICCIFFYLGLKRIAIFSLLLALLVAWILKRKAFWRQHRILRAGSIACMIFCFAYVVFIRIGGFDWLTETFHIDALGRNELYHFIGQYYEISPAFTGYGFNSVHMLMLEIASAGVQGISGLRAIHNDVLVQYIEFGFIGFWIWAWYTFVFQYRWLQKKFGTKTAKLFFLCLFYILFTYLTDNTLFYFWTSMILRLVPMAYAFRDNLEEDLSAEKLESS